MKQEQLRKSSLNGALRLARRHEVSAGRIAAVAILMSMFIFLAVHKPETAVAIDDPKGLQYQHLEERAYSAENVREAISLILTVSFGLAAVVGLSINTGFGSAPHHQAILPILTSCFVYFLARVLVYSYDAYTAMAVEFEAGYFFITRVQESVVLAARSLVFAAGFAFVLFAIKPHSSAKG